MDKQRDLTKHWNNTYDVLSVINKMIGYDIYHLHNSHITLQSIQLLELHYFMRITDEKRYPLGNPLKQRDGTNAHH